MKKIWIWAMPLVALMGVDSLQASKIKRVIEELVDLSVRNKRFIYTDTQKQKLPGYKPSEQLFNFDKKSSNQVTPDNIDKIHTKVKFLDKTEEFYIPLHKIAKEKVYLEQASMEEEDDHTLFVKLKKKF